MATKPTRLQQQACDKLSEAILLITEAARIDGGGKLDRAAFGDAAHRIAGVSSVFTLDEIVARALERRGRALGLPSSTAELLSLMEAEIKPLAMLLLDDDEFRSLVERMQEELGEV